MLEAFGVASSETAFLQEHSHHLGRDAWLSTRHPRLGLGRLHLPPERQRDGRRGQGAPAAQCHWTGGPEAERRRPTRPARLPAPRPPRLPCAWLLAGVMCSLLSRRAGQASLGRPEVLLPFFFFFLQNLDFSLRLDKSISCTEGFAAPRAGRGVRRGLHCVENRVTKVQRGVRPQHAGGCTSLKTCLVCLLGLGYGRRHQRSIFKRGAGQTPREPRDSRQGGSEAWASQVLG